MTSLVAPAKLTWFLEVTGRREDGLHELRSEMSTLELADHLELDEAGEGIEVVGVDADRVPADASNLVARALSLLGRTARVRIEKSIPVGGGLGGGSADAAAVLRWAGGVSAQDALSLGSDVPFCLLGGRALVEGVGERVSALEFRAQDVTLLLPDFGVNTAAVYRAYDEMRSEGWVPRGDNHLEEPAGRVEPRLKELLSRLRAETGDDVRLAGSGSSLFVAGRRADLAGWSPGLRVIESATSPF